MTKKEKCDHWTLRKILGQYYCLECGTPFTAKPKR